MRKKLFVSLVFIRNYFRLENLFFSNKHKNVSWERIRKTGFFKSVKEIFLSVENRFFQVIAERTGFLVRDL